MPGGAPPHARRTIMTMTIGLQFLVVLAAIWMGAR